MSSPEQIEEALSVNLELWSADPKADPKTQLERQVIEVFLVALGMTKSCGGKIFLKGGILIGAIYSSGRNTADIDFSTVLEPSKDFPDKLREELGEALPRATAKLGMPEILLDLQSVKFRPREDSFVEASYPAISAKFAYAERGSPQEKSLLAGTCSQVLHADISFNEPIDFVQEVYIEGSEVRILAYSLIDLVAEKYRAILQQKVRNRARRQDVFDLDYLISEKVIQGLDKAQLLSTFRRKCESRDIQPTEDSLDDPDVIERSERDWATLASEVEELPEFKQSYETVRDYYHSWPWKSEE